MNWNIKELDFEFIQDELKNINFDSSYLQKASEKYSFKLFKIYSLKPVQANILKQLALSVGADCAVHHDVITHKIELSDAILGGTIAQLRQIVIKLKKQPFSLPLLGEKINNSLKLNPQFIFKTQKLNLNKTNLMGILNVTPDSFSDGGEHNTLDKAIEHAFLLSKDIDILDIGGESTRPHSQMVDVDEEISRILPVLQKLKEMNYDKPISIDTRNAKTAKLAIENGCEIINDISGGEHDPKMLEIIANSDVGFVIMHSVGTPQNMHKFANYENIVDEVYLNLLNKLEKAQQMGIEKKRIILDIGLGFAKERAHNLELLKRIDEFRSLGCCLLVGASRKNFLGGENIQEKDLFTLSINSYLSSKGVNLLRVHNPHLHKASIALLDELKF